MQTLLHWATTGKLILIVGEPGIGKTRLVQELIAARGAKQRPALVLQGSAHELEQGLPYQPLIEALRGLWSLPEWPLIHAQLDLAPIWLSELARLMPELQVEPAQPQSAVFSADQARLWEALHQFLLTLARQYSVMVFLDDLHWADDSTLAWLGYMARLASLCGRGAGAYSRAASRPRRGLDRAPLDGGQCACARRAVRVSRGTIRSERCSLGGGDAFYEQALVVESDEEQRTALFLALGEACLNNGDFVRASDAFRAAIALAQAHGDLIRWEAAHVALNTCLIPQARYAEAIAVAQALRQSGPPELALCAEFAWGAALAIQSAQPAEAGSICARPKDCYLSPEVLRARSRLPS